MAKLLICWLHKVKQRVEKSICPLETAIPTITDKIILVSVLSLCACVNLCYFQEKFSWKCVNERECGCECVSMCVFLVGGGGGGAGMDIIERELEHRMRVL